MNDPKQGVAKNARRERFHDASVVYGLPLWSGGEGLVMSGSVLHYALAQLVYCPLVDDSMGCHCCASNFGHRCFQKSEGVPMFNIGGVQHHEYFWACPGTLVVSSCKLLSQVEGHLVVVIIFEWVGCPMAYGLIPTRPQRLAA